MSSNRLYRKCLYSSKNRFGHKACTHANNVSNGTYLHSFRDPAILDGLDLTEEERNVLIDNINRRLTPQAVKIRAGNDTL